MNRFLWEAIAEMFATAIVCLEMREYLEPFYVLGFKGVFFVRGDRYGHVYSRLGRL
jgi:hypothetical protein